MLENEPLLYIDSISAKKEGCENQATYDSRNKGKTKSLSERFLDLEAMLIYHINVECEVQIKNLFFKGIATGITKEYLKVIVNGQELSFFLKDITKITISGVN